MTEKSLEEAGVKQLNIDPHGNLKKRLNLKNNSAENDQKFPGLAFGQIVDLFQNI